MSLSIIICTDYTHLSSIKLIMLQYIAEVSRKVSRSGRNEEDVVAKQSVLPCGKVLLVECSNSAVYAFSSFPHTRAHVLLIKVYCQYLRQMLQLQTQSVCSVTVCSNTVLAQSSRVRYPSFPAALCCKRT